MEDDYNEKKIAMKRKRKKRERAIGKKEIGCKIII